MGLIPTPRSVIRDPVTSSAATSGNAAEEKSPGTEIGTGESADGAIVTALPSIFISAPIAASIRSV